MGRRGKDRELIGRGEGVDRRGEEGRGSGKEREQMGGERR